MYVVELFIKVLLHYIGTRDLDPGCKDIDSKAYTRKHVTAKKKAWRGDYCCVPHDRPEKTIRLIKNASITF